jgi:hypothetical protein
METRPMRIVRSSSALLLAFALALTTLAACKSSSPSGGAPCMGANPAEGCYDCQMTSCPSQFAQVESDCGTFLACEAQCGCSDLACLKACGASLDGPCMAASSALQTCVGSQCTSACSQSMGTMTANCAALAACCPQLPANASGGCNSVVTANNDSICQQQLGNYKTAGLCGSSSGGCAALSACCGSLTDPGAKAACTGLVQQGVDMTCSQELAAFKAAGMCP